MGNGTLASEPAMDTMTAENPIIPPTAGTVFSNTTTTTTTTHSTVIITTKTTTRIPFNTLHMKPTLGSTMEEAAAVATREQEVEVGRGPIIQGRKPIFILLIIFRKCPLKSD